MRDDTADRGSRARIPIWVRVPVIVALVLVGILVGSMLLGSADIGRAPGHGARVGTEMTDHDASPAGGSGEGHGGSDAETTDHGGTATGGSGEDHGSGDRTRGHG